MNHSYTPLLSSYLSGFLHNSIHLHLASFNDRDASLTLVSSAWSPGVVAKLVGDASWCHGGKSPETDTWQKCGRKKWLEKKNGNLGVSFWFEGLFCLLLENSPETDTWPTKCVRIFKMHPPEICEIDNLGVFKKIRCPIHLNPSRVDKFFAKIVCICKFMASLAKPHDEPVLAHKSTFEL